MRHAALGSVAILLFATAGASGQTGPSPSGSVVKPSANGVVKPGATVDPGMKVIRPRMPAANTPVIKPRTTTPDGSVVVPR